MATHWYFLTGLMMFFGACMCAFQSLMLMRVVNSLLTLESALSDSVNRSDRDGGAAI